MFEKIRDILSEQLDFDADRITPDTDIANDIGADSLDIVEFIGTLEDEFNISIPQNELTNVTTVGELAEVVEKLL